MGRNARIAIEIVTKEEKKAYKEFCKLVRIVLTGNEVGPDLYKLMEVLGRDEVVKRLKLAINSHD